MITNNYQNYSNQRLQFCGKFEKEALTKLKKSSSKEIENCIDSCCKKIEEWTDKNTVIGLKQDNNKLSYFTLSNDSFGDKTVQLCFPKKDNELIHSLLSITKTMLLSAEKFIKTGKNN